MARMPGAVWRPLPENSTQSRITPTQVIVHSAVDSPSPLTSLFGFFRRTDVTVESHFHVMVDGTIEQYMDTTVRADANRYANVRAISIETEDNGDPDNTPWTPAQIESILKIIRWAHEVHDIPLRVTPAWDQPGIGYHSMWGAPGPWTPSRGKTCPGRVRITQFRDVLLPRLLLPVISLEDDHMTDSTAQGLVILTYLSALGRTPESLHVIAGGGNHIKVHGLANYAAMIANSPEGQAYRDRLRKALIPTA